MSSERNIIARLMEGVEITQDDVAPNVELDERTYTVGDTQYWRRNGKCYSWTQSGGRKECSEDEYMKAISDGNPQATSSKEDKSGSTDGQQRTPAEKKAEPVDKGYGTHSLKSMPKKDMGGKKVTTKKPPKYWNTMFTTKVIDAYKSGKLTPDNVKEWETAYNDGIAPNQSLGTKEVLNYHIETGKDPRDDMD